MQVVPGEIEQRREDLKSNITLTARLENRDLGTVVDELQQAFASKLHLPAGYSIAFGGAYSEQQQSFRELAMVLSLATLLVLTVLMFLLREWRISLAVLLFSLTGICGCLLVLWLTGVPLNVSSYTGIIMIVGITSDEPPLDAGQIFNRFYHPSGLPNGNGLGLAIVKAICKYHGWEVSYRYLDGRHHFIITF